MEVSRRAITVSIHVTTHLGAGKVVSHCGRGRNRIETAGGGVVRRRYYLGHGCGRLCVWIKNEWRRAVPSRHTKHRWGFPPGFRESAVGDCSREKRSAVDGDGLAVAASKDNIVAEDDGFWEGAGKQ